MAAIVVEFFGMPASGKTHLCAAVAPGLRSRGWVIVEDSISRKASRFLRIASKMPLVISEYARSSRSRALFRFAMVSGCGSLRSRFRVGFNILFVRARIGSGRGGADCELLLHDQGCAQALWSAAWVDGKLLESITWDRLTDDLGVSFVVVDVSVPRELAASRARHRASGNSPIDGRGQRQSDLDRAWHVTEQVRAVLRRLEGSQVTMLESESGDPSMPLLVEAIDNLAKERRGAWGAR